MRTLSRYSANKKSHARSFRYHSSHTKSANIQTAPQRGGWRL
jgi:hypothetical protein